MSGSIDSNDWINPLDDYIFFWGCTIPGRYPFIEKSLRLLLSKLNVRFRDVEGFTCCPEKFLVETLSEEAWYVTAARNLALAEKHGGDLLVACNGCYATFRSAITAMHASTELWERVNESLVRLGLRYDFKASVHHIVEVLHDTVGVDAIRQGTVRPMEGMLIGAHNGCQLLRPAPAARCDDAARPVKLDHLVEALGATSLDYNSKLLCCGEALARSGNPAESMAAARIKLTELEERCADAIVVVCPACFGQFESWQLGEGRESDRAPIPVLYYSELAALAFGVEPEEMGLDMHRVDVGPFIDRWREIRTIRALVPPEFDLEAIETCVECESCSTDCPVAQIDEEFEPHELLRLVLAGRADDLIESEGIWKCLECEACAELCPNNFGMTKAFKAAKRMALERGLGPAETVRGIEMFRKTGVLGKTRDRARKKLGLGPVPAAGSDELAELLSDVFDGKDG